MATELDLRGLKCPLPVLRTQKRLAGMAAGERLAIRSDDPMAVIDIPHMCHANGHGLISVERDGKTTLFTIAAG